MSGRRFAVIGAGPVGLAAALGGARRGWDVTVLEREDVGASLRRWGSVRFFSPLSMNLPPGAAEILGGSAPPGDSLLTGPEYVERILVPLAQSPLLSGRIRSGHRVLAVGRSGLTRQDYAGHPLRAERPFRILAETAKGEISLEAEAVLDASGTYGQPTSLGSGGLPALGERQIERRLIRDLGAMHDRRPSLSGKNILLVGHGHSAAHAILDLAVLASESPRTRVTWAVRTPNQRPCSQVACDPLPERDRVVAGANDLAARPPAWLRMERRATVDRIESLRDGSLRVLLSGGRSAAADEVIGLTGYRPDLSLSSELEIDVSPVTEASGRLSRALSNVTDCLSVPRVAAGDLASGEPGFHFVGAKSYGRLRTFLLRTGYSQLETVLDSLSTDSPSGSPRT